MGSVEYGPEARLAWPGLAAASSLVETASQDGLLLVLLASLTAVLLVERWPTPPRPRSG